MQDKSCPSRASHWCYVKQALLMTQLCCCNAVVMHLWCCVVTLPQVFAEVLRLVWKQKMKKHVRIQSQVCHITMVQCCAHRPSKNKTRFRPRGPLDLLGALACGVVSLYARTVAWGGDAADEVLFHSPIGQSSCALASVLILQLLLTPKRLFLSRNVIPTLEKSNSETPRGGGTAETRSYIKEMF